MFLSKTRSLDGGINFKEIFYILINKFKYVSGTASPQGTGNEELDKLIALAGYAYDPLQDIFYSIMNPWQRNFGYCRLYDEAAAPTGMIIDCEPIYFEYKGKKWLIELWKGQFDLVTGGEIGVYTREAELNIPGIFTGTFYNCASDEDCLWMSFDFKKNDQHLFSRRERHWWLTGFKLGEFSEPWELTMHASITLHDTQMRDAFIGGLLKAGYLENELTISKRTVSLVYDVPRTPQPITRTKVTDWLIQRKNEYLCKKFMELTGGFDNILDKLNILKEKDPAMYERAINIGKNRQIFDMHDKIRGYLE